MRNLFKKLSARELFGNRNGFTLVEITVVLIIVSVILGLSILYYQTTQVRSDLNSQVSQFVSFARLAQSSAEAGKDGSSHGVHLESNKYVIFTGASYTEGAPTNYVVNLPSLISIQNVNLNGGGNDVVFVSPHGETVNYGSFDFVSGQINAIKHITILQIGTVGY